MHFWNLFSGFNILIEPSKKRQTEIRQKLMMGKITPQNATEAISQVMLPDVYPAIVDLEKSAGNRLFDSRSGRYFLDAFSYIASNPIGHNHPGMYESTFEKKLLRAARVKPSSSDFHSVEMAEFVDTFRTLAMPSEMKHLFLIEGGAVAVENAMKAAFDWKVRLNQARGDQGETGTKILHFREAFHGRCGYTLSVTNSHDLRKTKYFPKFDWPRIHNPKVCFPLIGETLQAAIASEEMAYQEIESAFANHGRDIAAILIETIQGEGGDNHFRPEFHHRLRQIADEQEAMLIYDEIQCGGGLTGKMWAYQHYGIVPDIICFGKKFQVCGIMTTARIEQVSNHVFQEASRLNSTWGGNLVDMVRSQRYLEIIAQENLLANAAEVGSYFQSRLREFESRGEGKVSNSRGLGLMCAVDFETPQLRDEVLQETFLRGALLLKCGTNSLRIRPSLTFTNAEADELISVIEDSFRAVLGRLG